MSSVSLGLLSQSETASALERAADDLKAAAKSARGDEVRRAHESIERALVPLREAKRTIVNRLRAKSREQSRA